MNTRNHPRNGTYASNGTYADVAARIRSARHVALLTHVKPDGDAVGSTLGLCRAIQALGTQVGIWYIPPLTEPYKSVVADAPATVVCPSRMPPDDVDLVIVLDTGAWTQIADLADWVRPRRAHTCILDHHIQGDEDLADLRVIDSGAAAASEMVCHLVRELGVEITCDIATPLYMGIGTDTGWFRYSNTKPTTLRLAGDLLATGVNHSALIRMIEQTDRPQRLRLLGRALSGMQLLNNDRIAIMTIRTADFEAVGAEPTDSGGFSDIPQSIATVEAVCVIAEQANMVKLSLRSKDGPDAIDVNRIAAGFGGGGHARAAGAKVLNRSFEEVHDEVKRVMGSL